MIRFDDTLFSLLGTNYLRKGLVWVYSLTEPSGPPGGYVGSTLDPIARYFEHLTLTTKQSRPLVQRCVAKGTLPVMTLLDLTEKQSRNQIEAKWINKLTWSENTNKLLGSLSKYEAAHFLYPCLSDQTLTIETPESTAWEV